MSDERGAFAYELIGLGELEASVPFEEFVERAATAARLLAGVVEDPDDFPPPVLLAASDGELSAAVWTLTIPREREDFLERVVAVTVGALAPEMVALASGARLPAEIDGAQQLVEALLLCALDRREADSRQSMLAAPLWRSPSEAPVLGQFDVIGEHLPPAYREALAS